MTNTTTLTVLGCAVAGGKGICKDCGAVVPDYCRATSKLPDVIYGDTAGNLSLDPPTTAPEETQTPVETPVPSETTEVAETAPETPTDAPVATETTAPKKTGRKGT